mmetsp:Transcript_35113/g.92470  ORF Transcript_35113/g.92470 Transcript_35113/m.92470 type:complete len:438 (-) Transcript_35113:135-1448(-)
MSGSEKLNANAPKGKITVFGIGRLGICTALCLERAGYSVLGVDVNSRYVDLINTKRLNSPEPGVNEMLEASSRFRATTDETEGMDFADVLFIAVATPSTGIEDRHYDHSVLSSVLTAMNRRKLKGKHVVVSCTVMPGYCRQTARFLLRDCEDTTLSYNPEFIAQGDVINGLLRPDMVLIGEGSRAAGDVLEHIYRDMTINDPRVHRMSPDSAEICKLAVNCFITTKIAFANMVGDIADRTEGADKQQILAAVGADSRIGSKYLKPGYGFGGPCFPRDNRALGSYARFVGVEPLIPVATDQANRLHTRMQAQEMLDSGVQEFEFSGIGYKPGCKVPIVEESQKLSIAVTLARAGRKVTICDLAMLVAAVQEQHGSLFSYRVVADGDEGATPPAKPHESNPAGSDAGEQAASYIQPHVEAQVSRALGRHDSFGVERVGD